MKRILYLAIAGLFLASLVPSDAAAGEWKLKTVVIDPGHGGRDPGCISHDGKTYEKNVTLDIAKRFAQKISAAYPEVRVIMTRTDDRDVALAGRADIANKSGADLFVSIHINSVEKGTTANGYSIHCLGQSSRKGNDLFSKNLDLCRRENAVITLEDDYKTTYKGFDPSDTKSYILFSLMQNAHLSNSLRFAQDVAEAMKGGPIKTNRGVSQDPFLVLWRTTMPSVLIETGFITNPDDLAAMRSDADCDAIAERLLQAFSAYKMRYDNSLGASDEKSDSAKNVTDKGSSGETAAVSTLYGTQVLATSRAMSPKDSYFQGFTPVEVKTGRLYKYLLETSPDPQVARENFKKIQKFFPDSFLVRYDGEQISIFR